MYWLEKLKKFKSESGMTYKEIAQETNIPLTTVEKLFSGRTRDPKLTMITDIVHALHHTTGELVVAESAHNNDLILTDAEKDTLFAMRNLDKLGNKRVKDTINSELSRIIAERNAIKHTYNKIYFDFPVSAGTGEFLDNRTAVIANLSDEPPRGTDYILRISGDSMSPRFENGDYVYVRNSNQIEYGEIGIFAAEGSVYMKVYSPEGLKSLNPKYKTIKFYDDVRCLGKVLGTVTGNIEITK